MNYMWESGATDKIKSVAFVLRKKQHKVADINAVEEEDKDGYVNRHGMPPKNQQSTL